MTFFDVEAVCSELRESLAAATGKGLIGEVSVDKPVPPEDELHYVRLVAWTYVFLVEVAPVPIRHIQNMLRGSDPPEHKKVAEAQRLIVNLRTHQAHQLFDGSNSDADKKKFVDNWLSINQGENTWALRIQTICNVFCGAISAILKKWKLISEDEALKLVAVSDLLSIIDRQWPAYLFDVMIDNAAKELQLKGLDVKSYRLDRLDHWKKLADCFGDRSEAETALRRAIRTELIATFGEATGAE